VNQCVLVGCAEEILRKAFSLARRFAPQESILRVAFVAAFCVVWQKDRTWLVFVGCQCVAESGVLESALMYRQEATRMNNALFVIVPVIFAVVALIVLSGFVAMFFAIMKHRKSIHEIAERALSEHSQHRQSPSDSKADLNVGAANRDHYCCSNCGANLRSDTEVSPSGDFKCGYCQSWSNVNR